MKFFLKLTAITLLISMSTSNIYASENRESDKIANPTMKIGIFYGSNAVPTTNLDNNTGSGHEFGFFDSKDQFISVFETEYEKITVMKDKNIYLGSDGIYYDSKLSNPKGVVGGYHIQLSKTYNNANDAQYAAMTIHQDAFVAYIDGVYKIRVDSFDSKDNAQKALSQISQATGDSSAYVVSPSEDTFTVTSTKSTKILFEFSSNSSFGIMPKGDTTWNKGYSYNGGFEYSRQNGNDVTVVNVVPMQDYIKGVIPYEMNADWEIEALKAQALCARSYAFNNINKHKKYGFDLCKTVDCQVYNGTSRTNANSDKAVDETFGEFISYGGQIATGFFYSSNGGATEDSENVWSNKVPYLRGKIDPYERTEEVLNGVWEQTITNEQIEWILNAKDYNIDGVSNMYISEYTDMGNVYTLTIVDKNGKEYDFNRERARTILNSTTQDVQVKSTRFRINETMPGGTPSVSGGVYVNDEEVDVNQEFSIIGSNGTQTSNSIKGMNVITADGTNEINGVSKQTSDSNKIPTKSGEYVISGRGWGHNVGMSEYGAKHMAQAGYTYKQIIQFYFTSTTVDTMK